MKNYTYAYPRGHKWNYENLKQKQIVLELLNAKEQCDTYWSKVMMLSEYIVDKKDYDDFKALVTKYVDKYIKSYEQLFYWESMDELAGGRGVFGRVSRKDFKYDSDLNNGLYTCRDTVKALIKQLNTLLLLPSNTSKQVSLLRNRIENCLNDRLFCSLVLSFPK